MALKQRETTRWIARVGTKVAGATLFVLEVLKSFLNFKKEDGLLAKGMKVFDAATRQATYVIVDYGLWFVSVGMFTTMKIFGFSFPWIFAALWAYDFAAAGAFIVFYEKTGKDLSFGGDFRRATDAIHRRSRLAGYMAMAPIVIRGIVWNGPEKIITFFRKEIATVPRIVLVLLVLTAIQAFIWAILYELGYGLVAD